jgi:hypothetical protein
LIDAQPSLWAYNGEALREKGERKEEEAVAAVEER